MGAEAMTGFRRAFYAPFGSRGADLVAVLHPPYTAWHLSYVVIGAALASSLDGLRLAGALIAFGLGTGVLAHALDEWHDRPLQTRLADTTLLGLAALAGVGVLAVTVVGIVVVSPWVAAWGVAGTAAAIGYAVERPAWMHGTVSFALAWGAFPVLVGYWAQTETLSVDAGAAAAAAALFSATQRSLSLPARRVRRDTIDAQLQLWTDANTERWSRRRVLATWERPLLLLAAAMVLLSTALALRHA